MRTIFIACLVGLVGCGGAERTSGGDDGADQGGGSDGRSGDAGGGGFGGQASSPDNGFWSHALADAGTSTISASCTGQYPARYELTQSNNFASPIPSPNGLAFDGQEVWVLSGGYSSTDGPAPSTLVRMSPATLAVDRTFDLDIPGSSSPGIGVEGLTWDGHALWTSSGAVGGSALFRIDPSSGDVTRMMSGPGMWGSALDLAFDGTDLWAATNTGDAYQVAPVSGGVLEHFDVGGPVSTSIGVAVRPCEVWVGYRYVDEGMQIYDPTNGQLTATEVDLSGALFTSPGASLFIGNQLVIANDLGITYYDVTPQP